MLPILKKISPFNHYNGGNNVQYIVLHDVGALGQVRANLNYFFTQSRGASAHLFVDDTEIGQSVEFYNPAFHVGDDKKNDQHDVGDLIHNRNSIGVEMCLDKNYKVTEKTKANTVELVHYLLKLYPNAKVVRHHDASGKICPRSMSGNNWTEWKVFYQRLVGNVSVFKPVAVNKPLMVTVTKDDTLWGISKQYDTDVKTLKAINGLSSDTIHVGTVLKLATTVTKATNISVKPAVKVVAKAQVKTTGSTTIKTIQKTVGVEADGWDGPNTRKGVVKLFQRFFGANDDGFVGNETLNKAKAIRFGDQGLHVYAIQALLYLKGYTSVGKPDKIAGAKFVQAVKNFQKDNGLSIDGVPGKATYAKLLKL